MHPRIGKLLLLILIFFVFPQSLFSQVARWGVRPCYSDVSIVHEKYILVQRNNKYGLITKEGKEVVPCEYSEITDFVEGKALLLQDGMLKGYVDDAGNLNIFGTSYYVDEANPYYSEGLLAIKNLKGRWGYIDIDGNIAINPKYLAAFPFSKGLASVRCEDFYFVHIDKKGIISYLKDGFNDDDVLFASSFTKDEDNTFALLNINNTWYKRTLNGDKVEDFRIKGNHTSIEYNMEFKDSYIQFDESWTPKIIKLNNKIVYELSKSNTEEYFNSCIYTFNTNDKGLYSIIYKDQPIMEYQWSSVLPIDNTYCLVRTDNHWGLLELEFNQTINVKLDGDYRFSHMSDIPVIFIYDRSSFLKERTAKAYVKSSNVQYPKTAFVNDTLRIMYKPDKLMESGTLSFDVQCEVDDILYRDFNLNGKYTYTSPFIIKVDKTASLDKNNNVVINVYIENSSSIDSGACDIIINNRMVKEQNNFKQNQKIIIPYKCSVDIKDEDFIIQNIRVEVRENGCPHHIVTLKTVVERYYENKY